MMCLHRIPARDWGAFCARFTRRHRGASLEVEHSALGREVAAERGRLDELVLEQDDRQQQVRLLVMGARQPSDPYTIDSPSQIELTMHNPRARDTLRITSAGRARELLLRFDGPIRVGAIEDVNQAVTQSADSEHSESTPRVGIRPPVEPRPMPCLWTNTRFVALLILGFVLLIPGVYYFSAPLGFWRVAPAAAKVPPNKSTCCMAKRDV